MKNLLTLLGRFTKSLNKDGLTKGKVAETVLHTTGVKLSPDVISIKEGVLTIQASPAAKNEMRLKEEKIKEALRGLHNIRVSRIIYT
ncbi:hypothetical protein KW784_00445 [Candidatus Parcubacteria bacterium]|nr:hypothetical protein [Candidatus Parcubacteria bacterium]